MCFAQFEIQTVGIKEPKAEVMGVMGFDSVIGPRNTVGVQNTSFQRNHFLLAFLHQISGFQTKTVPVPVMATCTLLF